jgi:nucleotide-binding universal stress UspA family protein
VRISRRAPTSTEPRSSAVRIILGIDGSPNSALAVSAVAARTWPAGTEVKIITALDVNLLSMLAGAARVRWSASWASAGPHGDDARDWAREAVESVAAELRAAGLTAISVVEEGNPRQVLLDHASQWSADCIFLGARGHSALERFLLGSVSAAVSARASCSVEVVRQG